MKIGDNLIIVDGFSQSSYADAFCEKFMSGNYPRYVLGRNAYALSISHAVEIDGFIDDFTQDTLFCGKPVVSANNAPKNSLVVSAVVLGRPVSAQNRILEVGLVGLDYLSFKKLSGLDLKSVLFTDLFHDEFKTHRKKYELVFHLLADNESRRILQCLLNYRLTHDLRYMQGFVDAQNRQYFEDFLDLKANGETFIDVGCFDGYTSLEFIRRCPGYNKIHVFEPDPTNMERAKQRLQQYPSIQFHSSGCSDRTQTLNFRSDGSSSQLCNDGDFTIAVDRIDNLVDDKFTFLKMDIEGGEIPAIEGARESILRHHPRLAICVYHKVDDIWRVPSLILGIRDDYKVYLRHYTEGVTETVMFFVPN